MKQIDVASCFLLNAKHEALFLYRHDHAEWQLPGGRVEDGELAISAAAREVHEKLAIAPTALHKVGRLAVRHGEVQYNCAFFQITDYEGEIDNIQPQVYGGPSMLGLFKRNIGRMSLSPIASGAIEEITQGSMLLSPNYPVQ